MRLDAVDPATLDVPGGVATRAQWRQSGANHRMFSDGRLVRVAKTVYAVPGVLSSAQTVATLIGGLAPPGATVTGWAAAVLHGVRDAGPAMVRAGGTPIQLCLARDDHRRPEGFDTLRVDLDGDDVEIVAGVRVTTLARTAYDVVRFCRNLPTAVALLDAFRCELNPAPLDLVLLDLLRERRPRGRGHPMLRRAVDLSSTRSRSLPESVLRARLRTALGLGEGLLVNGTLTTGSRSWELDLLDLSSGLAIEYDSAFHASTAQRERDALKDLEVGEAGLGMLRVNATALGRSDAELAEYVRRGQRRARLAGGAASAIRLRSEGRLRELPLRRFHSAVE